MIDFNDLIVQAETIGKQSEKGEYKVLVEALKSEFSNSLFMEKEGKVDTLRTLVKTAQKYAGLLRREVALKVISKDTFGRCIGEFMEVAGKKGDVTKFVDEATFSKNREPYREVKASFESADISAETRAQYPEFYDLGLKGKKEILRKIEMEKTSGKRREKTPESSKEGSEENETKEKSDKIQELMNFAANHEKMGKLLESQGNENIAKIHYMEAISYYVQVKSRMNAGDAFMALIDEKLNALRASVGIDGTEENEDPLSDQDIIVALGQVEKSPKLKHERLLYTLTSLAIDAIRSSELTETSTRIAERDFGLNDQQAKMQEAVATHTKGKKVIADNKVVDVVTFDMGRLDLLRPEEIQRQKERMLAMQQNREQQRLVTGRTVQFEQKGVRTLSGNEAILQVQDQEEQLESALFMQVIAQLQGKNHAISETDQARIKNIISRRDKSVQLKETSATE